MSVFLQDVVQAGSIIYTTAKFRPTPLYRKTNKCSAYEVKEPRAKLVLQDGMPGFYRTTKREIASMV